MRFFCQMRSNTTFNKIQQRFARAASTYDRYAKVQKESAGHLASILNTVKTADTILEIGCGTGAFTAKLHDFFPEAQVTAVDFAQQMLDVASEKVTGNVQFICRDACELLAENVSTYSLIVSNATWQWFDNQEKTFCDVHRALDDNGVFLFSVFGPRSLYEMGEGLRAVLQADICLPAASFAGFDALAEQLQNQFSAVWREEKIYVREFDSFYELLQQISMTGTAGEGESPLLTRGRIKALDQWVKEKYGRCQVTYQVFFFRCIK